ncbi:hypothetical protein I4U23_000303 [Adineta vaga]|nr:hypothetical protein I4U23_000303 [Adineta vaga]
MTIDSFYNQTSLIDRKVLSKICSNILPRIHDQVHKLTVEQYSMKRILRAANYPQLYSLSLINFEKNVLYQHLKDNLILRNLMKQILALIFSLCKNLTDLNFCDMFPTRTYATSINHLSSSRYVSSSLTKLKINVSNITDCTYILDGCLNLSILIIKVRDIFDPLTDVNGGEKFLKLKYFSLTTSDYTCNHKKIIFPLLRRMINLENLRLCLLLFVFDSDFPDGTQLYDQFLMYMTQLEKFTFSIDAKVYPHKIKIELPSNRDIEHSFASIGYQQVTSYVHTNLRKTKSHCLIYSLPYDFEEFIHLDNSFQGGMFDKVRQLKMVDVIPFEHKLLRLISKDFPCLKF